VPPKVVGVCCIPTTTLTDFSVGQATFRAERAHPARQGPDGSAGRPTDRIGSPARGRPQRKRPQRLRAAALKRDPVIGTRSRYLSSSPLEDDGFDEVSPPECPHDGAGLDTAGLGAAQLGAAGGGVGAGLGAGADAGLGAAIGAAGLGAGGLAAGAAFFFAAAFLADFFGAAAFDFLADFFADLLAFFADFLADFFEDFFADFFFAVTTLFLPFLAFLLFLLFFPLAIVILLLPPINVYRAFQVVRLKRGANRSVQSWPGTACRPIEKLNRVHHRN
jgi:hypothetical protein